MEFLSFNFLYKFFIVWVGLPFSFPSDSIIIPELIKKNFHKFYRKIQNIFILNYI